MTTTLTIRDIVNDFLCSVKYTISDNMVEGDDCTSFKCIDQRTKRTDIVKAYFILAPSGEDPTKEKSRIDSLNDELLLVEKNTIHPNIVQTIKHYINDGFLYILTEYCQQGNLYTFLQRQNGSPIVEDYLWFIITQLLSGIFQIHLHNIIHGNINLNNVLFTSNNIKLSDVSIYNNNLSKNLINNTKKFSDPLTSPGLSKENDITQFGLLILNLCVYNDNDVGNIYNMSDSELIKTINDLKYSEDIKLLLRNCIRDEEGSVSTIHQLLYINNLTLPHKIRMYDVSPYDKFKIKFDAFLNTLKTTFITSAPEFVQEITRLTSADKKTQFKLNLDLSKLKQPFWTTFKESLTFFPQLEYIDLSNCNLGVNGITILSSGFSYLPNLLKLNLSNNLLRDDGAIALAKRFKDIQTIGYLSLYKNSITDFGCSEISKYINSLKHIKRYYCLPSDIGSKSREEGLDLSGNFISPKGYIELMDASDRSFKRTHIFVSDSTFSNRDTEEFKLKYEYARCKRIKLSEFSGNNDNGLYNQDTGIVSNFTNSQSSTMIDIPDQRSESGSIVSTKTETPPGAILRTNDNIYNSESNLLLGNNNSGLIAPNSKVIASSGPVIYNRSIINQQQTHGKQNNFYDPNKLSYNQSSIPLSPTGYQVTNPYMNIIQNTSPSFTGSGSNYIKHIDPSLLNQTEKKIVTIDNSTPNSQYSILNYSTLYKEMSSRTKVFAHCVFILVGTKGGGNVFLPDLLGKYNKFVASWGKTLGFMSTDTSHAKSGPNFSVSLKFTAHEWENIFKLISCIKPIQILMSIDRGCGTQEELVRSIHSRFPDLVDVPLIFSNDI